MIRLALTVGLLLALSGALAQTWTDDTWGLKWNANPASELVQGYRVYIEQADPLVVNQRDVGSRTEVSFAELNLSAGRYEAWITAYNPLGESEPSARIPFVYVTEPPGGGTGLSAPGGLELTKQSDDQ